MPSFKTLRRSRRRRMIAGICAGLSDWLGLNVTLLRVIFVVGSVIPIVPGFLVYLILWMIVPQEEG